MARASVTTLLPLDTFAKIVGIHPLHFNQVELPVLAPASVCGTPFVQYSWQEADRVGREEIAQAIAQAEEMIANEIGFKLLPTWEVEDRVNFTPVPNTSLINVSGTNVRGVWQAVKANWGYVHYGGIEAKSLILASAPIVYSDVDGDGYNETATIACATTVTDPEEIAIYYPGEGGDNSWEIRPTHVVISGGVAVITCRREQLVIWDLMEQFQPKGLDGLLNTNFLLTVDVYRHYNDPSRQIRFVWEPLPNTCNCGLTTCTVCSQYYQYGCLMVRDYRPGQLAVTPASWEANTSTYVFDGYSQYRQPEKCYLWYRAGWKDTKQTTPTITMDPNFARAVSYLAISLLDRPMCTCDHIEAICEHWKQDFAFVSVNNNYRIDPGMLRNPLGTTRGAQYAWRLVQKYKIGESVSYA